MFLVDTSVWLASTFVQHPAHGLATSALSRATSQQPAVFCRATQQSFLRLASTPAIHDRYGAGGMTNEDAITILDRFMASPGVTYGEEPQGIAPLWHQLAGRRTAAPKVWMDAYLAAFAIAAGFALITLDADFRQYEAAGLKLQLLTDA